MMVVIPVIGFACEVADRVAVMDRGRIVETGPVDKALSTPRTRAPEHCLNACSSS